MSRRFLDELKQQMRCWTIRLSRGRLMGLCPLQAEHHPSFLVDPSKRACSTATAVAAAVT